MTAKHLAAKFDGRNSFQWTGLSYDDDEDGMMNLFGVLKRFDIANQRTSLFVLPPPLIEPN